MSRLSQLASYRGIPQQEWQDYIWQISFQGTLFRGPLMAVQETENGICFGIKDGEPKRAIAIIIAGPYQEFFPFMKKQDYEEYIQMPVDEEQDEEPEESEDEWKQRIIQHDIMAAGMNFLGKEGGTVTFSQGTEAIERFLRSIQKESR